MLKIETTHTYTRTCDRCAKQEVSNTPNCEGWIRLTAGIDSTNLELCADCAASFERFMLSADEYLVKLLERDLDQVTSAFSKLKVAYCNLKAVKVVEQKAEEWFAKTDPKLRGTKEAIQDYERFMESK